MVTRKVHYVSEWEHYGLERLVEEDVSVPPIDVGSAGWSITSYEGCRLLDEEGKSLLKTGERARRSVASVDWIGSDPVDRA